MRAEKINDVESAIFVYVSLLDFVSVYIQFVGVSFSQIEPDLKQISNHGDGSDAKTDKCKS